ncbi:MAG: DUF1493 family protein [Dysgonomonas sp.]|nr:DUF1493 family protein [Dysgonomonas sp.]
MTNKILNSLKDVSSFIRNFDQSYESVNIDENTRLEEDLGITGDDAWEFFIEYRDKYNVDVSQFLIYNYFKAEGVDFISPILLFLGLKKKKEKKEFTVKNLIEGIKAGRLNEEVINNSNTMV